MLAKGFDVETAPEALGRSRVYFNAPSDFQKLRSLVLAAYEEEVKNRSNGNGADVPDVNENAAESLCSTALQASI